ncbi:hypothetical protein M569_03560 [Genlisea aurea]|uniref:Uncharacterized protein n=1 Tax=Genlisea aurea TaxID=192259 RepID=S8CV03_9LAMI|nr:hypothetical protein M569_03560 [Genlisea aurea]
MASRSAAGAAADYALLSSADGRAVSLADSSPMEVLAHLGPATDQEAQQTISCLSSFSMIGSSLSSVPEAVVGALQLLIENNPIKELVSSLLRDANIWNAFTQNPVVKKLTSASVVMANEISSTPGLLEGAPAPVAGGSQNFFDKVWQILGDLLSKFAAYFIDVFSGRTDPFGDPPHERLSADVRAPLHKEVLGLTLIGVLAIIIQRVIGSEIFVEV